MKGLEITSLEQEMFNLRKDRATKTLSNSQK